MEGDYWTDINHCSWTNSSFKRIRCIGHSLSLDSARLPTPQLDFPATPWALKKVNLKLMRLPALLGIQNGWRAAGTGEHANMGIRELLVPTVYVQLPRNWVDFSAFSLELRWDPIMSLPGMQWQLCQEFAFLKISGKNSLVWANSWMMENVVH